MFDIKKVEDKSFIYALNEFGTNAWHAHVQPAPNGISEADSHTLAILFKYSPKLFHTLDRILSSISAVRANSNLGHSPDFLDSIMVNQAIEQGKQLMKEIWDEEKENRRKNEEQKQYD